jgi:transketolase
LNELDGRQEVVSEILTRSRHVRKRVLEAVYKAGKGHLGGALSIVEILSAIYFSNVFTFGSKSDTAPARDRLILSKGHAGVGLYAVLTEAGWIDEIELTRLNAGHLLAEHPSPNTPGVEFVSGSLGHGLSVGVGFALADKIDQSKTSTIVVLGDGECYEGSVWEAAQFAGHHKLRTLLAIVDRNGLITYGPTEEINEFGNLENRWKSFGWNALEIDGHNVPDLMKALQEFKSEAHEGPLVLIANTLKGKGVRSLEGTAGSHHGSISDEQLRDALEEMGFEIAPK